MEAAIAATYIGTLEAFSAMRDVLKQPMDGALEYAIQCALGSQSLRRFWESDSNSDIAKILKRSQSKNTMVEPKPSAADATFDRRKDLQVVKISCVPERMAIAKLS